MRKFLGWELQEFLQAVDTHLSRSVKIKVLGGSAFVLGYALDESTKDIDVWETNLGSLERALEAARRDTGLRVPVDERATVGDVPYDYEDRLERVMPELRHLVVLVLERHDLALSKSHRGYRNDLQAIKDLNESFGLDPEILISRYVSEMYHAIGDPRNMDTGFLAMLSYVYDDESLVERARQALSDPDRPGRRRR